MMLCLHLVLVTLPGQFMSINIKNDNGIGEPESVAQRSLFLAMVY